MPNQQLDLTTDSKYNLIINKNKDLSPVITAQYLSGNTLVDFDFSSYTGATLTVRLRPDSEAALLVFDTNDGSIVLSSGATFQLNKTALQLRWVKAGEYVYDMYLRNSTYSKRAFMSGIFIINNTISQ